MTQHEQSQKICIPNQVMNSFCYPFSKALLLKLKELQREDRVFEDGIDGALDRGEKYASSLTGIASSVIEKMCLQFEFGHVGTSTTPSKIQEIIELSEEFLAIFEVK